LVEIIVPFPVLLANMEDTRLASSLDLDAQVMMYVCYANSPLSAPSPPYLPVLLSSTKHHYLDVLDQDTKLHGLALQAHCLCWCSMLVL
jgi:hypothetical protein